MNSTITIIDIITMILFVITCGLCIFIACKINDLSCRIAALELGYDIIDDRLSKAVTWLEKVARHVYDIRTDTEKLRDASVIIHRKGVRGTPKETEDIH